jgi:Flp pilus assembly protein TadD
MLLHKRTPASVVLPALLLFIACSHGSGPETQETLMRSGVDALYMRHDPTAAATEFRKVLQLNPLHYGATYQLATALDAAGKSDEARTMWGKMLPMAEAAQDKSTAERARARLAEAQAMQAGLDALYSRHEPDAAAAQFRKVLDRNPTHYGATYQLAAALDAAGRRDEARPLWEKMLQMAEASQDLKTANAARARLQSSP